MTPARLLLLSLALALPATASAQQAETHPFRHWDIGGGLNLRFGESEDPVIPHASWSAEGGHYWTPHLKTSIGVMTARQDVYGDYSYAAAVTRINYTRTITGPTGYSASAAYQFFDNEFVHPYVTAGLRFASTYSTTTSYLNRAPYTTLVSSTPSRIDARPVVGGGFKSYFGNGRAFMRSELLVAINPDGSPHAVLHIGAGVDF